MSEQPGPQQVRSRSAADAHMSGPQMTPAYYSVIRVGAHLPTPAILTLQVRRWNRREATHTARSAERRCAAFGDIPATRSRDGRGSV